MSEVAKVRAAYLHDHSVSHADYGRMIQEAAEADRVAEVSDECGQVIWEDGIPVALCAETWGTEHSHCDSPGTIKVRPIPEHLRGSTRVVYVVGWCPQEPGGDGGGFEWSQSSSAACALLRTRLDESGLNSLNYVLRAVEVSGYAEAQDVTDYLDSYPELWSVPEGKFIVP